VVASCRFDIIEALGVNTRSQLADVERVLRQCTCERLMLDGVSIVAPEQTSIDPRAVIGRDTVIHPFTVISGPARIGQSCRIGPHAVIEGPVEIAEGASVGPFQVVRTS
ncbi:MAG TPA: glycosyl transferase family 2, partial [Planctomycetaceae bacterium]|nr:glycosyl transferase family 2 [Planctomycetaceae bacterium]